jgi:hypothetical protein
MFRPFRSPAARGALVTTALLTCLSSSAALAESRTFELDPFTAASFESDINATIVAGAAQTVIVDARSVADLEDLRIEVVNGQLHARVERDFWDFLAFRDRHVTIVVSVPVLDRLTASAGASVEATGMSGDIVIEGSSGSVLELNEVDANAATINASSGAQVRLDGLCLAVDVQLSSGASVAGRGFECGDVDVEASSGSSATLFAKGHVNATASSGALVNLAGHPLHVDDDVSSGGDVDILY